MKISKGVQDFPDLPISSGKRPITIRGPLHVQCGGYGDELSAFAPGNRPAAAPKVLQMFQRPDARGAARHKNAAIGTKTNGFELISVPSPD